MNALGNWAGSNLRGELSRRYQSGWRAWTCPQEQVYLYLSLGGTGSYHLSGMGAVSGEDEAAAYAARTGGNGQNSPGPLIVTPIGGRTIRSRQKNPQIAGSDTIG